MGGGEEGNCGFHLIVLKKGAHVKPEEKVVEHAETAEKCGAKLALLTTEGSANAFSVAQL